MLLLSADVFQILSNFPGSEGTNFCIWAKVTHRHAVIWWKNNSSDFKPSWQHMRLWG